MSDNFLQDIPVASTGSDLLSGSTESAAPQATEVVTQSTTVAESAPVAVQSNWYDSLPDDIKTEASLSKFKDIASLAKSYIHQEKLMGSSVRVPGTDAKPEDISAFIEKAKTVPGLVHLNPEDPNSVKEVLSKLGAPSDPSEYQLGDIEKGVDEQTATMFKQTAAQLGLTNAQAKTVAEILQGNTKAVQAEVQKTYESALISLQKEWGHTYNDKIAGAREAFGWYSDKFPAEAAVLKATAGNNPVVIRMLSDMHSSLKERGAVSGQGNGLTSGALGAREKIAAIKADPAHPVWSSERAGHKQALQELNELYNQAYSSPSKNG